MLVRCVDVRPAWLPVGRRVVIFTRSQAAQERIAQRIVIARVRLRSNPERCVAVCCDVIQVGLVDHNRARELEQDVISRSTVAVHSVLIVTSVAFELVSHTQTVAVYAQVTCRPGTVAILAGEAAHLHGNSVDGVGADVAEATRGRRVAFEDEGSRCARRCWRRRRSWCCCRSWCRCMNRRWRRCWASARASVGQLVQLERILRRRVGHARRDDDRVTGSVACVHIRPTR